MARVAASALALLGGEPAVRVRDEGTFRWPIVTPEMEAVVLDVLRRGAMSDVDVTQQFEAEFAAWLGTRHALAHNTGTAALHAAMFAVGVGRGDEVICPSLTYWASCLPAYALGAAVVFADVEPDTLCLDPADVARKVGPRTRAIVAVHYAAHPADMDPLMAIAERHGVKVIEDASHAHGALYKGRMVGTFGHAAAFSLMSGKSMAIGEGGMLATDDRRIYERAVLFGHYERHGSLELDDLRAAAGLPWGGVKYRMHQLSSAVGRVQLRSYPAQMAEIDAAMNLFWDLLEGVPGVRAHRPPKGSGTTKGGWYAPAGHYRPEELGGLSVGRFCEALRAEGFPARPGVNRPLHLHPLFEDVDVYGDGRPTRWAFRDGGALADSLPVTEAVPGRTFGVPWFKKPNRAVIEQHAAAVRKVVDHHRELLAGDQDADVGGGTWGMSTPTRS